MYFIFHIIFNLSPQIAQSMFRISYFISVHSIFPWLAEVHLLVEYCRGLRGKIYSESSILKTIYLLPVYTMMDRLNIKSPQVCVSVLENFVGFIHCIYELKVSVKKAEARLFFSSIIRDLIFGLAATKIFYSSFKYCNFLVIYLCVIISGQFSLGCNVTFDMLCKSFLYWKTFLYFHLYYFFFFYV